MNCDVCFIILHTTTSLHSVCNLLTLDLHVEGRVIQLASNPGSLFRILSRSFGEKSDFSPKLRDKIRNGEPGFEAMIHLCL